MLDNTAIKAIQQSQAIENAAAATAGALATFTNDTRAALALPSDFTVHDLEKYLPTRRRLRGSMQTPVAGSFAEYVIRCAESGATVFVDPKTLTATAVLNLGTPEAPGHADNLAHFAPPKMAAFAALLATATGAAMPQQRAAEWMEDWQDLLICLDAEGKQIQTSRAIAAVRRITIEAMSKRESEAQQLRATTSTFEDIQAKSSEPLPSRIEVKCVPLPGLPVRTFSVRFGILTGEKTPGIVLRIVKLEEHLEQMAIELADLVAGALDSNDRDPKPAVGVALGTYQRG